MIGKKRGLLKIIEFSHKDNNNYWKAKCECGNIRIISTGEWNRGRSPILSCGCKKRIISLVGEKFNYLEVIEFHKTVKSLHFWLCKCVCSMTISVDQYSLKKGRTKSCGCITQIKISEKIKNIKELFLKKVNKKIDGCWEWMGYIAPNGYGRCPCKSVFTEISAHRSSYKIFVGEIPENMWVLHKCDNKRCVNPKHLYLGNVKDNVRDAIDRGQWPIGKNKKKGSAGEKNNKAKLSEKDVLEIRNSDEKSKDLSKKYNVCESTILNIIKRITWNHIQ